MWKDFRTLDTVTTTASSFVQIAVEDPVQAGAIAVSVTASLAESAGSVLHQAFIEGDPGAAAKTSAFVTEAVLTGGGIRTIARNAGKSLLNASNKTKALATATIDKAKRAAQAVTNAAAQAAKSAQVLAQRTSSQLRTIAESFNESVNQRLFGGSTAFDPDVRVNGLISFPVTSNLNDTFKRKVPQGFTENEFIDFANATQQLANIAGLPEGQLAIQGSRVNGTARPLSDPNPSDIDIILRVDDEIFDSFAESRINSVQNSTRLQKTLIKAATKGKLSRFDISRDFNKLLFEILSPNSKFDIDFSIIKKGSKFDTPPFIDI